VHYHHSAELVQYSLVIVYTYLLLSYSLSGLHDLSRITLHCSRRWDANIHGLSLVSVYGGRGGG